jgi:hypothetical protein
MAEHNDDKRRGKIRRLVAAITLSLAVAGVAASWQTAQEPASITTTFIGAPAGGGGNTGNW